MTARLGDSRLAVADDGLNGSERGATAVEIQTVTALLERTGARIAPDTPTVVFAYPGLGIGECHRELSGCTSQLGLLAEAAERLTRMGIGLFALSTEEPERHEHIEALRGAFVRAGREDAALLPHADYDDDRYLLRWTMFLGGHRHGRIIEVPEGSVAHTQAVIKALEDDRLRAWAAVAGADADARLSVTGFHANGADSVGIVAFDAGLSLVAKIGPRAVVEAEVAFVDRVCTALGPSGGPRVFPKSYGILRETELAASVMEQVDPETLDCCVFADEARFVLAADAVAVLGPHLDLLAALHRGTGEHRVPDVARYLYRDRFQVIRQDPGFLAAFSSFFSDYDLSGFLASDALLPDGARIAGYSEATAWLDEVVDRLVPESGCLIHGDPHLKNMLRRGDGGPTFVDPRTVWDGRERTDPGYGDPAYDFATLLHSALPMSGVLAAIDQKRTGELVKPPTGPIDGVLDLSSLTTPTVVDSRLELLERELLRELGDENSALSRTRLYVGAADALAGWLKYQTALQTPEAWLTTYAYVLWYLARARTALGNTLEGA